MIVKTLCRNVIKSKIRKEEDEVDLTATGVYFLKHKVRLPTLNITQLVNNITVGSPEHNSRSQQSVPLSQLLLSESLYEVSPRDLLEQDTGVCHLQLTHLLTAHLPTLSPAADLAEPHPFATSN